MMISLRKLLPRRAGATPQADHPCCRCGGYFPRPDDELACYNRELTFAETLLCGVFVLTLLLLVAMLAARAFDKPNTGEPVQQTMEDRA